jgi:hypothetical protein
MSVSFFIILCFFFCFFLFCFVFASFSGAENSHSGDWGLGFCSGVQ